MQHEEAMAELSDFLSYPGEGAALQQVGFAYWYANDNYGSEARKYSMSELRDILRERIEVAHKLIQYLEREEYGDGGE